MSEKRGGGGGCSDLIFHVNIVEYIYSVTVGFVYSADADGRRDTCVFGRRVYSADGKFTIF